MTMFEDLYLGHRPDDFIFSRTELNALAKVLPAHEIETLKLLRFDSKMGTPRKDRPKDYDYSVEQIHNLKKRAHEIMDAE